MKIRLCTAMLAIAVSTVPAQGADKVRIGVSNYNISNLTVGVAQTKDFFKQEGIEAEIIRMNPNVATMALVSGDIDYSTLIGSVIGANLKGAKLKMIACSQDRTPLSLVGKAAIKSVKELKGKTIGVGSFDRAQRGRGRCNYRRAAGGFRGEENGLQYLEPRR